MEDIQDVTEEDLRRSLDKKDDIFAADDSGGVLVMDVADEETEEDKFLKQVYGYASNHPKEVKKQILEVFSTNEGIKKEMDLIASQLINDFFNERKEIAKRSNPSTQTTVVKNITSSAKPVAFGSGTADPRTSQGKDMQEKSLVQEETVEMSLIARTNIKLPRRGNLDIPEIKVGDQVLAAESVAAESLWTTAVVKDIIEDKEAKPDHKLFKISFLSGSRVVNIVNSSRLAFMSCPDVMVKVGTHVVAYSFSGMIAETAKVTNGGNYLIFFEKGDPMYVSPEEVFVCSDVVFKPDRKLLKADYADFLITYMQMYPEKKLLRLTKGEKVDLKSLTTGKWIQGVVIEVLYSLVRVYFPVSDHLEWVYRGSHRIRSLVGAYNPITRVPQAIPSQGSLLSRRVPVRSAGVSIMQKIQKKSNNQPLVLQYVVDDDDKDESQTITGATEECQEHKGDIFVSFLKQGQVIQRPTTRFKHHVCSARCVKKKLDMKTLRGHNPFVWPIMSGWSRFIFELEAGSFGIAKKYVMYMSPCGKMLRNIEEVLRYLKFTDSRSNPCLGIELFSFEPEIEFYRHTIAVVHQCVTYIDDLSNGQEKQPISNINFLDDEVIDPLFEYCSTRSPTSGVDLNLDPSFLVCCDCEDDCENNPNCSCQNMTKEGFNIIKGMADVYPVKGYQNKRLHEAVPFGIYECNSRCRCNANCGNRVVQNGISVLLQVFKTSKKGWGVRVLHDIPKGTFIASYSACIFNEDHADDNAVQTGDEYFATLDFIECAERNKEEYEDAPLVDLDDGDDEDAQESDYNTGHSSRTAHQWSTPSRGLRHQQEKRKQNVSHTVTSTKKSHRQTFYGTDVTYILDAKKKGNVGRFFNHSCSPNCFPQNVFTDTHDLRYPMVCFFASRTIYALEEVSWDYNYEIGSVPDRKMYCYCKSVNCRGRLL